MKTPQYNRGYWSRNTAQTAIRQKCPGVVKKVRKFHFYDLLKLFSFTKPIMKKTFIFILGWTLLQSTVFAQDSGKIVYDFETGDLQGWTIVEGKFDRIVSDREFYHNRYPDQPGNKYNKTGKYYFSTVEQQPGFPSNDTMTGIVESPSFRIEGPEITFRIGGGDHPNAYFSLCLPDENGNVVEVLQARGRMHEVLFDEKWDVSAYLGKTAFFRVVDHETQSWGHVTLDQIELIGRIDDAATAKRFEPVLRRQREEKLAEFQNSANLDGLRQMVEDLEKTFADYTVRGEELRKKLDAFSEKVAASDFVPDVATTDALEKLKREIALSHPLVRRQPICFVSRHHYDSKYHAIDTLFNSDEFNPDFQCEHKNFFSPGAALKLFDPVTEKTTTLLKTRDGVIRDPDVYFDAGKIVFSFRKNREEDYKIWEMVLQKNGDEYSAGRLTQLTFAKDVADFDPIYLADDSILFSSTREPKYNMCSRDIAANLYRMESDGANIVQITKNTLFDHNAEQLPDGRILYHRWDYVDRNFGDAHAIWTVNPDGTNQSIYWGNNTTVPGAVYNPRLIPGSNLMLCVFGPHHAREMGALALVDRRLGLDGKKPVLRTWPADQIEHVREGGSFDCDNSEHTVAIKYEDPFPLSDKYFLCSRYVDKSGVMGIYLIDLFGNEILLHREASGCFDPMPLASRTRPEILSDRREYDEHGEGTLYLANVYEGTHMEGVEPGSIKSLRVVETPEKRHWAAGQWFGQGYTAPGMNWHSLESKRILGTVPVEPDGSASFTVPADTFLYFQALDENGKMVQTMRSGTILQSGEVVGCVGCHEDRLNTPKSLTGNTLAMKRQPHRLADWCGPARKFGYLAEVQPVFDKHCVSCHDFGQPAGEKLLLSGDQDLVFNVSYVELWRKGYVSAIGAGPAELQPARSWGSHRSRLIKELEERNVKEHAELRLENEEMDRLITWVDLNGVYYPDYSCAFPENMGGRCPLEKKQLDRLTQLTDIPFFDLRSFDAYGGPYVSFDRPELSPCLAKIADPNSAEHAEAVAIVREGAQTLRERPRCGTPGFVPCDADLRREAKYEHRKNIERLNRNAIQEGSRHYDEME